MNTAAAVANHLNILESTIAVVEEWAHVLFVKFVSGRPRFVSKKVLSMSGKPAKVRFEDLAVGQHFTLNEGGGVIYRVGEKECNFGKMKAGYKIRAGKWEYIFGFVYLADSMTEEQVYAEQSDHAMWGRIWASHDQKLKADIA